MKTHQSHEKFTRRDFLRLGLATGGAIALAPFLKACRGLEESASGTPTVPPVEDILAVLDGLDIDRFFEESFRILILRDPEGLTELGLGDVLGVGNGSLTDLSDAFIRQTQALETVILARLQEYDHTQFTPAQEMTAGIYEWYLDDLVRGHEFMYDDYPINPIITSQNRIHLLSTITI